MPSQPHHTRSGSACQAADTDLWTTEVVPHLPGDLEAQARSLGAFTRRRLLASATDLLRGVLAYVLLSSSFRHLGAWAVVNDVADMSAVAWQKRLVRSRPWLAWLLGELLAVPPLPPTLRLVPHTAGNILLVDATTWAQIGGRGDDWRFHLAYNFSVGRLAEVIVTDTSGGEHLGYYRIQPNDIIVADGGYGYRASVATVRKQQAHLITRIRPQTFPFELDDGRVLDIVAQLRFCGPNVREWAGWCTTSDGERYAVRLIAAKLPAHAARQAQARARRNAQKGGRTIQPQTLLVAGWVVLITTLPARHWSAAAVLRVYRVRWQVELVFKRLKSGLTRAALRGQTRASLEASILALLIAWVLQTSEAAHLRARLSALGQDDGWVRSSWGLTTLSVDVLRQQVRGGWGSQRVQACLPRLQRFLTSRVRHDRTHQETTVRIWLDRRPRSVTEQDVAHPDAFFEGEDTLS